MKTHAAISAALLLALAPCRGQVIIRGEGGVILKGGVIINNGGRLIIDGNGIFEEGGDAESGAQKTDAIPAGAQVLELSDGSRLHGTLEKIDGVKKEVLWHALDASSVMGFQLDHVSHWDAPPKTKPEIKVHATVKLTGGDWLAADLIEVAKDKVHLRLDDGTALAVDRTYVAWIYFSKAAAVECYDGPQDLSGWVSDGGWTYREGALRAAQPSVIGRMFEALPDQVEYRFEFDQGPEFRAFAVLLHGSEPAARGFGPGMVRLVINDMNLQLWAQRDDQMKQEQVDLSKILPGPKATDGFAPPRRKSTRWRIFEDRPGGRLLVFIDGRKVADWRVGKGKAGENRGSFSFQPMAWSGNSDQSLSKIRVLPWDGFVPVDDAIENVPPRADQVILDDGDTNVGHIESAGADKVKVGATTVGRENIVLMRFARPQSPPDEDPPVARVRLAQRGEFEVASLAFQEGKLRVRTNFAGELTLPAAGVRGLEFAHLTPLASKAADTLIFKNGDQLRGLLDSSATGQKLRWKTSAALPAVELELARVAGVLLAPRGDQPPAKTGVLARCRNGDLLVGDFISLDPQRLALESSAAGPLSIPRERLQALYFSHDGKLPVLDGASEHEVWERGLDFNRGSAEVRKRMAASGRGPSSGWSYFDGMFAVKRTAGRPGGYNNGNFNLGRLVEGMPARVEFSFDVVGKGNQMFFSAYLFSEPDNPGYMMQLHPGGLFMYDTGGQQRRQAMQQQLQIQFGDKVKADALRHRIRILADRPAGRVTVVIDDVVVASYGPKAGAAPRNLGNGIGLMPQQNMACTFANLWVAPWNGQLPGPTPVGAVLTDSLLFANGDETQGAIGSATPELLRVESELGPLEVPVRRLTMAEFGGHAPEPADGVRLRLHDRSVLTVDSYRIENEKVVCQSAVAGEVKLPLSAVQELVFGRPAQPGPAKAEGKSAGVKPIRAINEQVIEAPRGR